MIHLIDRMFVGWQPHDIMWYSWCIMAGLILLCWAIGLGIKNRITQDSYEEPEELRPPALKKHYVHGSEYDIPLGGNR